MARKLSLCQHGVGEAREVQDDGGCVKEGVSELGYEWCEKGCRQDAHVKVKPGCDGSGEHEPRCITQGSGGVSLGHFLEEIGVLDGLVEPGFGVCEKGCNGSVGGGKGEEAAVFGLGNSAQNGESFC